MPGKPEISIESQTPKMTLEYVFDAPMRQVFEAWTQAEQVKCWYRPGGSIVCVCDIDLRVNGKWRIVLKGADGQQHGVSGEYREIDQPRRLVQTFRYDGAPQNEAVETLTFSEKDGKTVVTSAILHKSAENLDWHVQSGAQEAAADVLGRLADHLRAERAGATALASPDGKSIERRRRRIPQIAAAGVATLALAGGGLYWASREFAPHYQAAAGPGASVGIVEATGVVEAAATTPIRAKMSGEIEAVYCDMGSQVTAGQICARLDPRPFQSVVDREKAALAEALDKLAKAETAVAEAKARVDENQELAKRRAAARKALDKSRLALERAETRKASDEAAAARARAALQSAEAGLADSEILSPVAGTIIARNVEPGQTVGSAKEESDLFSVASDPAVRVVVDLSGKDIDGIEVGDKVSFIVDGISNHVYEGQVGQIRRASAEDKAAGDRIVVDAPNADLSLKSGMKATLRISAGKRDASSREAS